MTLYIHAADVGFCDCPDILPPDVPTEPTPVVPQPPPGNNFYTSNLVKNLENLTPCSLAPPHFLAYAERLGRT